ncbi:Os02g0486500 [Oryza sativa Japonica Group]|uniref:Anthocyanin 5-aromatic acyltransferase-like protein n=1 Tax=Oryza sativa subsp. japonica TaxID=39947 RepID=Q6K6S6_ORYSJ|nr:anthocyanin 5-aromatic acyltransferase-like protein [Oryza sativa Japonica Group]BAD21970.1 anthocyanin 5-aromatic acyltransferase-like protein [Oryza sativa Japonica Group]BAF08776.2 Os02g0486500 [Oryza sativa Japonica Group]|eukprot:NP_001046862.2 Os02g0486500 [Oryza sativa Japonica Group]
MASQPAAHAAGLRVLRTTRVAPAPPAGEPALPERALPLMFMDAMWLRAQPVERVFFYRLGPGDDDDDGGVDAVLSRMEESLPRAIHAFYPLASRIRPTPSETNRYELLYQLGDGVAFTVAEHDGVGVDELATDEPRELAKIAPLVPELPEGGAVLALQVTVLPPKRRGLALGVIVHHSACDGVGSTHFLHTWAAACAGDRKLPELPVIDRTLIRDELADAAGGVFTACAAVAVAIDEAVRGEPAYWEGWTERVMEACRDDAPFSVAGSTRFRVYDVDFGFGRPAKVEIVSVAKTGAVSAAEDRSGAGGIEVGIALPPESMDTFRRCLADATAWLSSSSQCN